MENFNLNFQKLAKSNQKSQKLGKNGNLNYFPTASIKSYWEPGSQDPTQFARLRFITSSYSENTPSVHKTWTIWIFYARIG